MERGGLRPADTVAIVGAGALGLLVLNVRLLGATRLIVSDLDQDRRELAQRLERHGWWTLRQKT